MWAMCTLSSTFPVVMPLQLPGSSLQARRHSDCLGPFRSWRPCAPAHLPLFHNSRCCCCCCWWCYCCRGFIACVFACHCSSQVRPFRHAATLTPTLPPSAQPQDLCRETLAATATTAVLLLLLLCRVCALASAASQVCPFRHAATLTVTPPPCTSVLLFLQLPGSSLQARRHPDCCTACEQLDCCQQWSG